MEKQATKQEQEFSQEANKSQNLGISSELVWRTDIGIIKDAFLSHTSGLSLPQFCFSHTAGIFESEHKAILQKSELLKGFSLASADASVILDFVEEDIVMIDKQEDESSVTHKHLNVESQSQLLSYLLSLPEEKQLETIIGMIVKWLDKKKNEIKTSDLHTYVRRVIDGQEKSVIEQLHQNYHAATRKISDKLDTLQSEYAKKVFLHELEAGNITLESTWTFPEQLIVPTKTTIEKGLYTRESDVSGFERSMLERVASQSNVVFWHRILQRKGFVINGWINHHPDFLIQTQSGKTVLVETKWDQLDGSDSKDKIELWRLWQEKSWDGFKYIMLFQDKEVDGAKTLDEFLSLLSLW